MKHLTIIFPGEQSNFSTVACIAGTFEIIAAANSYRRSTGKKDLFTVQLAGSVEKKEMYGGMFTVKPQVDISSIAKTDLIVIPSSVPFYQKAGQENAVLIDWIKKQYKDGAEVASICSGAFMLASSGLLDGRNCSTHWAHADAFRQQFPKVNLKEDQLITDEKGIYTNGGAYSFLNLMVFLVEKYYDRQTAIYCSKIFQIELDRNRQSAFAIFTGQKLHGDTMVEQAQIYIESQLNEKISVDELSAKFSIGRRNFDRRFIKATGNTPIEYAQRVKIESAKKALETSRKTVNEVMYEVGYSDVKAFREVFRKITGISPLEYRSKYNKDAVQ
ncbi:GlxA family transcriptional regulator [Mucilaginibacter sp. OK098]|uniref:GlxA family transcriptional regulator n=1 Tax=Mucilaginibacter sp. OK098 TaxID=1855297 RepID=UPI00091C2022|nr:helix-turn-helix domain-containing protein [Mucilaginibacter sp. OK098]SHN12480.1 Transcriptional regulator GlxA family, contains an amidase domain and an AraC-type DNA-binding HTH domain [Mucilaginibacter sp. OK098]